MGQKNEATSLRVIQALPDLTQLGILTVRAGKTSRTFPEVEKLAPSPMKPCIVVGIGATPVTYTVI